MRNIDEVKQAEADMDAAFAIAFSGNAGEKVLAEINRFCGKDSKCVMRDPYDTYLALGMRSVALYIQDRLAAKFSEETGEEKPSNYKNKQKEKANAN